LTSPSLNCYSAISRANEKRAIPDLNYCEQPVLLYPEAKSKITRSHFFAIACARTCNHLSSVFTAPFRRFPAAGTVLCQASSRLVA
jgi:hypothetical protein